MDKDEHRRGKKDRAYLGEPVAILAGDVLYARFQSYRQADAPGDAKVRKFRLQEPARYLRRSAQDMSFEDREDVRDLSLRWSPKRPGALWHRISILLPGV